MLDIFNIPGQQDNVKIFYARGTTDWQTWTKPRNCKFIWMMCMGGGAGGGGGSTAGNSAGYGGGGGAITKALFPSNVLPDILYIQPGSRGIGGLVDFAGSNGNRSWVAISQVTSSAMNVVCVSGNAGATGGGSPLGSNGAGESAATTTIAGLLSLGTFTSTAGPNSTSVPTYTPFTTTITCPGTNGGNPGTNIASVNLGLFNTPDIPGGVNGSNGGDGVFSWKPFYSLGGTGGGLSPIGLGGKGGDGAYGSGGGGNGGGSPGGSGGNGGDGLVIIATF